MPAALAIKSQALSTVASRSRKTGVACAAATRKEVSVLSVIVSKPPVQLSRHRYTTSEGECQRENGWC